MVIIMLVIIVSIVLTVGIYTMSQTFLPLVYLLDLGLQVC